MHVSETSLVMLLDDGTTETVDQDPAKLREIAKNLANISVKNWTENLAAVVKSYNAVELSHVYTRGMDIHIVQRFSPHIFFAEGETVFSNLRRAVSFAV